MDMQKIIDAMGAAGRNQRSNYHLTLGDLISNLEKLPETATVVLDVGAEFPGQAISYRGYYSDLAFVPSDKPKSVGKFLDECRMALGNEFTGYKGGEYLMDDKTPLWIAHYGSADSRAIIGVGMSGDNCVIHTKILDD